MYEQIIGNTILHLQQYSSRFPNRRNHPIFLFLCGGDDSNEEYVCRAQVKEFLINNSGKSCLNQIQIVKPETFLNDYTEIIDGIDLLDLEAIIAELSDAILLFDEAPGPICELGAFAMVDATRDIMTACIPLEHKNDKSFIVQGPIRHLESCNSELANVIYLDIKCPFSSYELESYFYHLVEYAINQHRFTINTNQSDVKLGSFCRECLDLISIFSPIRDYELLSLYKRYKGFDDGKSMTFTTNTIMHVPNDFNYRIVFAYLASMGLVVYENGLLSMSGKVPGYFMFNPRKRYDIQLLRARLVSSYRKDRERWADVCHPEDVS